MGREAIKAGVHPNRVREIFHEYEAQVANSLNGTFTHLLLARGAISPALYDRINSTIPSDLDDSQAAIDTSPLPAHTHTASEEARPVTEKLQRDYESTRTIGFGGVLEAPGPPPGPPPPPPPAAPAPSPELTMAYEDVIDVPSKPSGGSIGAADLGGGWGSTVMTAPGAVPDSRASGVIGLGQPRATQSGRYTPNAPVSSGRYPAPTSSGHHGNAAMAPPPAPIGSPVGEVASTAGDSRSRGGSSLSRSAGLGASGSSLELVSDSAAERDAEFFEEVVSEAEEEAEEDWALEREPQPGDVFGNFRLRREIGRGGMGVIYEAQKIGSDQSYALKTLKVGTGGGSSKRRIRFQREVEALRRLTHTNIVGVHDYGRKGPYDFYAMDFIPGRELKDAIQNDDLTPRQKLDSFIQVCEAVAHAHERNVIHRDLKPANVLLNEAGDAFVLDFGLAKLSDESLELTKTGAALGTPYYMAPEQIKDPSSVDARVDIFALGVILFELMTGQKPFQGQTAGEVTHKIMNTEPPKPSSVNDKLRPALDAIVLKALEKDKDQRYQTVDELRREVAKYRRGDRVRDASDVAQFKNAVRRYWSANMGPLLIGFFAASALYLPWIYLLL